jgi:transposase InsO family protein
MGRYLVEAHLREGRPVAELAAAHGVHRSWIYKLLARYRAEGEAGLAPRSRRPQRSPCRVGDAVEDEVVLLRKRLSEEGLDAGALTISWHLSQRKGPVPSVSTIWRILIRRGFVVPQPAKRPKSSFVRFEASLPNECWQSDMTHWALADGTGVEIVNVLDDHSRFCVASVAFPVTRAPDVAEVLLGAIERHGTPAAVLTDNGCIYTAKHRGGRVVTETLLESLGVAYKHSRPYHPQTCGKVERLHLTLSASWPARTPPRTSSPSRPSWIASWPSTTAPGPIGPSVATPRRRCSRPRSRPRPSLGPAPRTSGCAGTASTRPAGSPFVMRAGCSTSPSAGPTPGDGSCSWWPASTCGC